ncbi:16S rRNA (guanine(966)-N(2))-methyltransferase RsmD [Labilibaculum antarcticum]|uniref:16S rRNA (Guanine(966)-N(2))-methyltransferase RsmD n=1 Tax=Labilibaculum antarcticum TaxID=1717717 RepID=A0A1Y1CLT7_9BACT|nr:16S rRNA (guanine(966)-N(2))-methyltransferase RsmD [Labilibaculum antarcticum]BAX81347.1 16S rRNA (guanine(966)-N(2))-methyltransferase RsmD [Labilibaculum antarcticum]
MRIVSGTHKGRRISPDKNFKARPTTDLAKENLFNVLNNIIDFEDLKVLDLFSGTGSISYEFASRGAGKVMCVEKNHNHFSFIQKTIKELKFEQIQAVKSDVFRFLRNFPQKFDLIFADPPFEMKSLETIPELVFEKELLTEDGILIVEHGSTNDFSTHPNYYDKRVYGSVNFSFFKSIKEHE